MHLLQAYKNILPLNESRNPKCSQCCEYDNDYVMSKYTFKQCGHKVLHNTVRNNKYSNGKEKTQM